VVVPVHVPLAWHVAVGAPSTALGMNPAEHVAVQLAPTRVGLQEGGYTAPVGLVGKGLLPVEQAANGSSRAGIHVKSVWVCLAKVVRHRHPRQFGVCYGPLNCGDRLPMALSAAHRIPCHATKTRWHVGLQLGQAICSQRVCGDLNKGVLRRNMDLQCKTCKFSTFICNNCSPL
jgi:hypothetical protein